MKIAEHFLENVGNTLGETIGTRYLDFFRRKAEDFQLETFGKEHLHTMADSSFILAANHVRPKSKFFEQLQTPPDLFVIEKVLQEELKTKSTAITKSDDGWWSDNETWRLFQKNVQNPIGRGIVSGMGLIPVQKNPGSLNRTVLEKTAQAVAQGQPIIIFPEGHWYEDFDPQHPLDTGAANLSLRFGLPILPAYINGAWTWQAGQEVSLAFGKPIYPGEHTKQELTEEIRSALSSLQQETPKKHLVNKPL